MRIVPIWMPKWFQFNAFTIKPYVFIRSTVRLPECDALLRHEQVHLDQQSRIGLIKFVWQYFFSAQKRIEFETEAMIAEGFNDATIADQLVNRYRIKGFGVVQVDTIIRYVRCKYFDAHYCRKGKEAEASFVN